MSVRIDRVAMIAEMARRDINCNRLVELSGVSRVTVTADYFIPATYIDPTGRELPSFYLTEMGCEMVANKMTGDKGMGGNR